MLLKLHESIINNINQLELVSGTYFGATGWVKLYNVILTRLLMRDKNLNSPTIMLITDRNDLDKQLSELFVESKSSLGVKVLKITTREELK